MQIKTLAGNVNRSAQVEPGETPVSITDLEDGEFVKRAGNELVGRTAEEVAGDLGIQSLVSAAAISSSEAQQARAASEAALSQATALLNTAGFNFSPTQTGAFNFNTQN